jgi:hypothetical protein
MFDTRIQVDLDDLERLIRRFPEASEEARVARMTEALALLEREVKERTPEGAGPIHLRDTIFGKTSVMGRKVHGFLGTPAKYGESVELGTAPHFPPVEPIRHWVEKKLRISGNNARSVAYMIARAISRRGTKGAHMFGEGFDASEARVVGILEKIPGDITTRVNS